MKFQWDNIAAVGKLDDLSQKILHFPSIIYALYCDAMNLSEAFLIKHICRKKNQSCLRIFWSLPALKLAFFQNKFSCYKTICIWQCNYEKGSV